MDFVCVKCIDIEVQPVSKKLSKNTLYYCMMSITSTLVV